MGGKGEGDGYFGEENQILKWGWRIISSYRNFIHPFKACSPSCNGHNGQVQLFSRFGSQTGSTEEEPSVDTPFSFRIFVSVSSLIFGSSFKVALAMISSFRVEIKSDFDLFLGSRWLSFLIYSLL